MPKITLEDMTPEQQAVIEILVNEGRMRAYEDLIKYFEKEHFIAASEDPYYAYYVKHVLEKIHEYYDPMAKEIE
jgi:hypothetical protein